jgi:hypothetical protein
MASDKLPEIYIYIWLISGTNAVSSRARQGCRAHEHLNGRQEVDIGLDLLIHETLTKTDMGRRCRT